MATTCTCLLYHVVFSTKNRSPIIPDNLRPRLWEYFGGTARETGHNCIRAGGTADHVHLALRLSTTDDVATAVKMLKANTSKWINDNGFIVGRFSWQEGYGAFTFSPLELKTVCSYIDNQEEHHRTRTFQDEFRSFLKAYEIEFDERYIWG